MGTSKVYTSQTQSQTSEDVFRDRVVNSMLSQPVDLDCKLSDSHFNKENATLFGASKRKSQCAITCSSESSYTRKAVRPLEILDWFSGVHLILAISSEGSSRIASGTVVASRYVLTAASNVFSRESNREVDRKDIKISAENDKGSSILKIEVIEILYSKKYATGGEEDLALLLLDREIGAFNGSFGLKSCEAEQLEEKSLYLCGYETLKENQNEYQIRRESELKVNISRGLINCSIDLRKLLIGSVVYYEESNKYYAVGVLTPSFSSTSEAVRVIHLNSSRIQKLESWIRKCSIKYSIITSLDLSLFPYSTSKLLPKLQSRGTLDSLISLDLSRNSLGPKGAKTVAKLTFRSLSSLNLERNDLGCKGAREIARGKLGNITHLKLGENEISFKGAKDLAFGKLKNLIELDIQDNRIGDEGAILISRGNFKGLTMLNLSKNVLGPIAAKGLATGNLVNLRCLNLSCNQLGDYGAVILAQGNTVRLQELDVSSNSIGIEGAATLSNAKLVEITKLNLERNNIRERTAARLSTGNARNLSVGRIKGCSYSDTTSYSLYYNGDT
jgi:hypothetical protein